MCFSCFILSSDYLECIAHYPLLQRSLFMCRYKRIRKQKYIFDCSIFFEAGMVVHVCVHKSLCLCTIRCVFLSIRISAQIVFMGTLFKSYRAYCYRCMFLAGLMIEFEEKNIHICEFLLFLRTGHIGCTMKKILVRKKWASVVLRCIKMTKRICDD